ncbi:hypothetical protein ACLK2A_19680 [Escherichia coli]
MIKKTRKGVYLRGAADSQRVNWNAILRGATKKKRKSGIGLLCSGQYFDLQRLFYRFSCSKITQILTLEYEVVAMSVSKNLWYW